ncbi:hypothetical protein [Pandoraea bronchicola]|uniref:hypothetical protein n=1 Tax=Pandoraea bronchicola TaxID=2508287 RepID=UPI0015838723|nr:hypothetical protein [Pandoraea bronchicola]
MATYKVAEKSFERGKTKSCNQIILAKVDDPTDRILLCIPPSEHEIARIGRRVQISGKRSRFINQLIGVPAAQWRIMKSSVAIY